MLLVQFLNLSLLALLVFLLPFLFLLHLHLSQGVLDLLCCLVVACLDEVAQIFSLFEDM